MNLILEIVCVLGGAALYFMFLLLVYILVSEYEKIKKFWKNQGLESCEAQPWNIRSVIINSYTKFRSRRLIHYGLLIWLRPLYIPIDLFVIRHIMRASFNHFVNHSGYINEKADPLSRHLLNLKDSKWSNLRMKLTPAFTPQKLKMMFETMIGCTEELVKILECHSNTCTPLDVKDVSSRFTTDIIGSVAFGIECNSLKDPNTEFRKYGQLVTKFTWRSKISRTVPPFLLKLFNFSSKSKDVENFFINLTREIIEYRESNNIYRKDFMHLLLQLKNRGQILDDDKIMDGNTKGCHLEVEDIAAQCFVFFTAGFETSSTLMSFTLLELAQNQDVQDKVRKELRKIIKKHGNVVSYEAVSEMQYLDQVVNETLRLHPPTFVTGRVCNEDFHIPGSDFSIRKGMQILIPIYNIHHDPEYYKEPFKFNPDRFSMENKSRRNALTFIPFGDGPRMCLGSRFGVLQSKLGIIKMLTNFKLTINEKTKLPIEYDENSFFLAVKGGVWLNVTKVGE